jgi:hypothetical protein
MNIDTAVLNRQGMTLFNYMSMKHQNGKRIGDLTIGDFVEMIAFLAEMETKEGKCQIYCLQEKQRLLKSMGEKIIC